MRSAAVVPGAASGVSGIICMPSYQGLGRCRMLRRSNAPIMLPNPNKDESRLSEASFSNTIAPAVPENEMKGIQSTGVGAGTSVQGCCTLTDVVGAVDTKAVAVAGVATPETSARFDR